MSYPPHPKPSLPPTILTDPFHSPATAVLLAVIIIPTLLALCMILQHLHRIYRAHLQAAEAENVAYERLLAQQHQIMFEGGDERLDIGGEGDGGYHDGGTPMGVGSDMDEGVYRDEDVEENQDVGVNVDEEEDVDGDSGSEYSDDRDTNIVRRSIPRRPEAPLTVPRIKAVRKGRIARRRAGRE